ncbi:lipoprotein-releasing system ABC transporter ATP-binding protein lolD [Candidatus Magnetoovum chiemensis]|nr:lipoprotein-releasing system ABC transporter ATP-binding protein lolD [Candidatus Magnetoovum chiemensis]
MEELIVTEGLCKSFTTKAGTVEVLKSINFTVLKGEIVAIVGMSGAGKSTFLHILGALDRPSSGKVFFREHDIFSYDESKLAVFRNKALGFIFQFHYLLNEFSALENVMMPGLVAGLDRVTVRQRAVSILESFGLEHRLRHRPGELSGGEQQRVAVARALILNPQIVFADEPTGNLDTKTGENIIDIIFQMNRKKGIAFVIVTHNEHFASRCHRIYEMVDGTIVEK